MREEEARRIAGLVRDLRLAKGSVCLNIGSSTRHFRETMKPHISRELINPLTADGVVFVNCDMKADDGVDLVGDVLDPAFQQAMSQRRADILLCCNLLEHLTNPGEFAAVCGTFVRPGGYMVVSVPYSYPYHEDPIDTMLRPSPSQIAAFFPDWKLVRGEVVVSRSYLQEVLDGPDGMRILFRNIAKALMPFYRPRHWWGNAHRLLWLFRPFKVSVALLRKPE